MVINKEWFVQKINSFLLIDDSNIMSIGDGSLIFNANTIVGFVSANDPIFEKYKEIIGEFHLTPIEAFKIYCKRNSLESTFKDLSVVAYVLPINEDTKKENFEYSNEMPSERWAHTRLYGEQANQKLQKYLINELKKKGVRAIAPMLENYMYKVNRNIWASTWSHRHMLYATGLGSFGLSDGFINPRGKAMRCGSIIVDLNLPSDASKRPSDPYKFCTKCGDCIKNCPVNAITFEEGHNKHKCSEHVISTIPYINEKYGINIYACGLCQVGVSCSSEIPKQ
ncbi:MAG: 4Fe-4S binding protein [Promethearchaeota archaeon]